MLERAAAAPVGEMAKGSFGRKGRKALQVDVVADILRGNGLVAEDQQPVHNIVQLANVPWPALLDQKRNRLRRKALLRDEVLCFSRK